MVVSMVPALSGCGSKSAVTQNVQSSHQARALMQRVIGADISESARGIHGSVKSVFTTVVDVRFSCSKDDFQKFLDSSEHLSSQLVVGNRTVVNTMSSEPWWNPDRLESVRGRTSRWETDEDSVPVYLMVGHVESTVDVTVYVATVLETLPKND